MKKVLIVEDEVNILTSLVFVLEKDGFAVDTMPDGAEAVDRLRSFRPDLLILDIMLPNRNGYEICHEIQRDPELRNIPTIMLTAKAQEAEKRKGLEVGATEYITKPFRVAELRAKIHRLLDVGV